MELFASDFSDFEKNFNFSRGGYSGTRVSDALRKYGNRLAEVEQRVHQLRATEGDGRLHRATGQTDAAAPAAPEE
jgi:hypothetical protein